MKTTTCKNCNQKFKGNFCNNCGQSAHSHELSIAYFWHEIQHGILHVDKGILFTTKELFTRPGYAIKDYISGKRVSHFKPFAYIFILSSLYAVLAHFLKMEILLQGLSNGIGQSIKISTEDAADVSKVKEVIQNIYSFLTWIKEHYPYTNVLSLPVFSLASYIAFYKNGFNYFEHLILNSYIAGQRTVLFILLLPVYYFISDQHVLNIIDNCKTVVGIALIFWTFNQFFNSNKWSKNLRKTFVSFFYLILIVLIIVISVIVVIALIHFKV